MSNHLFKTILFIKKIKKQVNTLFRFDKNKKQTCHSVSGQ